MQRKQLLKGAFSLLLLVVVYTSLYYLITFISGNKILIPLNALLFPAAIYGLSLTIRGIRFTYIVNSHTFEEKSLKFSTGIVGVFASWGLNSFFPGRMGEVFRLYIGKENDEITAEETFDSIVIEKVFDFMGMSILGIFAFTSLVLGKKNSRIDQQFPLMLFALFVFCLIVVVIILNADIFTKFFSRIPYVGNSIERLLTIIKSKTKAVFTNRKILLKISSLTLTVWILDSLTFVIIVQEISSIPANVAVFSVIIGFLTFIFPILPNAAGQFESAVAFIFILLGYPGEDGFSAALYDHITKTIVALGLGIIVFLFLSVQNLVKTEKNNSRQNSVEEDKKYP